MGIAIDIGIILIVLIFMGIGIYKGFMDSLLKLIGSVGALVIAIFAARPTVSFLDSIFGFTQGLGNICVNWFCGGIDPALLDAILTEGTKATFIDSLGGGIADSFIKSIVEGANVDAGLSFREVISSGMGTVFGAIIAGIVLFLLIKFIVFLLAKLFDSKEKPVLSGVNRALGMIFGAVKGGLFVVIAYTVLSISCMVFPIQASVDDVKNQTTLFKGTYDPYAVVVQDFVNDKMGEFVENFTANLVKSENQGGEGQ